MGRGFYDLESCTVLNDNGLDATGAFISAGFSSVRSLDMHS